jgi:isopenicillin-N synthase
MMSMQADVPTIDVSPLFGSDQGARSDVARQIDTACRGSGFFYAAEHGVDLRALQETTGGFHQSLTDSEKWELAINAYNPASPRNRSGYYMAIKGKKANESFCYLNPSFNAEHPRISAGLPMHEVNVWPDAVNRLEYRSFYEQYYRAVFNFSAVLLRGFALALGREEKFFSDHFKADDTLSAVSLIRYPYLADYPPVKIGSDGTKLSFEHHQDVSLITVLYQTPVPNLQVLTKAGYEDIRPSADCFLVNCGTYMAHVTNNYYPAPVHRVKFINAERLSIPFFVNLSYDSLIPPFAPHRPDGFSERQAIPYGEYLQHGLHSLIVSNGQT